MVLEEEGISLEITIGEMMSVVAVSVGFRGDGGDTMLTKHET